MNKVLKISTALLLSVVATSAVAAPNLYENKAVTLGYQNDRASKTEGTYLEGSLTKDNYRVGVNTLVDGNSRMVKYGVLAGLPVQLYPSQFVITPNLGVEHYRDKNATNFVVRLDADYIVKPTVLVGAKASYSKTINNNKDLDGAAYSVGITKLF